MKQGYVVAVSGGVDSVVLLDMLARGVGELADLYTGAELVVAHFDHGARDDSAADAWFVAALAKRYKLPFMDQREELGAGVSEAVARERRYRFLRQVAQQNNARIITAHHADDMTETVGINLIRGTGWRGLAVFGAEDIERPFLNRTKNELYQYAVTQRLEWVEDQTNATDYYLRNRVRTRLARVSHTQRQRLGELRNQQHQLKLSIEQELKYLADHSQIDRYFLTQCSDDVASEVLRWQILQQSGRQLARPAIARALLAIKTAAPGTVHQLGDGVLIRLGKRDIIVEPLE